MIAGQNLPHTTKANTGVVSGIVSAKSCSNLHDTTKRGSPDSVAAERAGYTRLHHLGVVVVSVAAAL